MYRGLAVHIVEGPQNPPRQCFNFGGGTYNYPIIVCVNQSKDEVADYLEQVTGVDPGDDINEFYHPESDGTTITLSRKKYKKTGYLIILNGFGFNAYWHGVIAHEAFHTVALHFEHIGLQFEVESGNEAWAYEIDRVVQMITEGCWGHDGAIDGSLHYTVQKLRVPDSVWP